MENLNPDIASQAATVGVVKATQTMMVDGSPWHFAVIERVTYPNWIIENVGSHNAYAGAYGLEDALDVIRSDHREMP